MLSINPANTQAILIGASQFEKDDNLLPLPAVKNNVRDLRALFADPKVMGIPDNNIISIVDELSREEILLQLESSVKKASDTLIIYYAGHGVPYEKALYLATTNTEFSKPQRTGALAFSEIRHLAMDISVSTARKIIFILDCCYSGLAREEKYQRIGKKDIFIMAAASEIAKAPPGEIHTAFTREFLRILDKGIDNHQKTLTLLDIYENLKNQLVDKGFPKPQQVIFNEAYNLKIAYNRAYQSQPQNEEQLLAKTDSVTPMSNQNEVQTPTQNEEGTPLVLSGKIKIQLCQRLGADWQELAIYLEIPPYRRNQFRQGRECQAIWEWLEERNQLVRLKKALYDLDRQDLVELLSAN
jgi:hypothetical protein